MRTTTRENRDRRAVGGEPPGAPRGRGSLSNRSGRFERVRSEPVDDGLDPAVARATRITPETPRRIIGSNESPDVPFDRSINPYKGCEHGCSYCFARPTHAYLGLSPGLDFETRIFSKPKAPELLRRELSAKGYHPSVIALGSNTDPYQPAERELRITRRILEVLAEHRHPASVVTKSTLVLRDLDLLTAMATRNQISVFVSITTLDEQLQRKMEPRASTTVGRLSVLRELRAAGVPCGVLASPMIPALNDWELERILTRAADAGAERAGYLLLRLPLELREIFQEWLRAHYPARADHVFKLIRDAHEGELYRSGYGHRMRGSGAYAEMLQARFDGAVSRLSLSTRRIELDCTAFEAPSRAATGQLSLF